MHGKVEKIGVDLMNIIPGNPCSDELFSVDISPPVYLVFLIKFFINHN